MKPSTAFLDSVTVTEVDELIDDITNLQSNTHLLYAIDPYDVTDFCFPLDLKGTVDSDRLADDQVALHSFFYLQDTKPILLEDYDYEMESILAGIGRSYERGIHTVQALVQGRTLDQLAAATPDAERKTEDSAKSELLAQHFSLILAISIGVFAESFERYRKLRAQRLMDGFSETSVPHQEDAWVLQDLLDQRPESSLAQAIYSDLMDGIETKGSPAWVAKLRQNRLADAFAINRVVALNESFADAYHRKRVRHLYRMLYVSGSDISTRIFAMTPVTRLTKDITGSNQTLLRNRKHFLLKMITEGPAQLPQLRRLRELLVKRDSGPPDSRLEAGEADDLSSSLQQYESTIHNHYQRIKNYGLVAETARLRRYLEIIPDASERRGYNDYVEFLEEILTDPRSPDIAAMQRDINIYLTDFKTDLRLTLLKALSRVSGHGETEAPFLRSGRDPIVGKDQYLPTVIEIEDQPYDAIVDAAVAYFRTPPQGFIKDSERRQKTTRIRQECANFLDIDMNKVRVEYPHELTRCLLFFAVPTPNSDAVAFEHACELLRMIEERNDQGSKIESDFRYLACWAARRKCDYKVADQWARESLKKFPEDPRFSHARALTIYCWFKDSSARPRGVTMSEAVEYGDTAVALYQKQVGEYSDVVASLFNSLACFCCFRLDASIYDITRARSYLNQLKSVSDKLHWIPNNPEYLHTEAYVEYEEFREIWSNRERDGIINAKRRAIKKLKRARQEIGRACKLYKDDEFLALKEIIETSLSELEEGKEIFLPKMRTHVP